MDKIVSVTRWQIMHIPWRFTLFTLIYHLQAFNLFYCHVRAKDSIPAILSIYLLPWWIMVLSSWCMSVRYEKEPRRNWGSFCNPKCNLVCLEYLELNQHVISSQTLQKISYKTTLYLMNSFIVAFEFTLDTSDDNR